MALLRLVLLAPAGALACACTWAGPFRKVALAADLVVLAEVRAYDRHGMDVAVVDVLKGKEDRPIVRIWGDTGSLCRPYVRGFALGTRWILAVRPGQRAETGGYVIPVCGDYWLEARGDKAIGLISTGAHGDAKQSAPLADVLAWLRSGGATPLIAEPFQGSP